ncbi:MAG: glycine zipper 2TM domain-containing protein, partial [Polaromonas sp.]
MKKTLVLSTLAAASGLFAANASAMDILARVISSTPVVQQIAVPQQVCTTQPMVMQAPPSGAGAVMGALAGGAMGNAIGDGGGRALATMIGLVGG